MKKPKQKPAALKDIVYYFRCVARALEYRNGPGECKNCGVDFETMANDIEKHLEDHDTQR